MSLKLECAEEKQVWLEARALLNGALKTLFEYRLECSKKQ